MAAGTAQCSCKVGSVLAKYDIPEYDDQLVDHWTGDADRTGVRTLADEFNRRVLEAAYLSVGKQPLSGEIENLYRLLTSDTVTSGMRTQARDQLEQDGVPIDEVEADFVSHQTIYRHLTSCRDVDRTATGDGDPDEQVARGLKTIQSLRGKTMAVTENTVERLVRNGALDLHDFDVYVDVTVACNECGRQVPVEELLEDGGCRCTTGA